jgi:hypothetical protein
MQDHTTEAFRPKYKEVGSMLSYFTMCMGLMQGRNKPSARMLPCITIFNRFCLDILANIFCVEIGTWSQTKSSLLLT